MIRLTISFGYALQWAMVTAIVCYAVWAAIKFLLRRRSRHSGPCSCDTNADCSGCPLSDKCNH